MSEAPYNWEADFDAKFVEGCGGAMMTAARDGWNVPIYAKPDHVKDFIRKILGQPSDKPTTIEKPWRCARCGRRFIERMSHKCNGQYRRRGQIWDIIAAQPPGAPPDVSQENDRTVDDRSISERSVLDDAISGVDAGRTHTGRGDCQGERHPSSVGATRIEADGVSGSQDEQIHTGQAESLAGDRAQGDDARLRAALMDIAKTSEGYNDPGWISAQPALLVLIHEKAIAALAGEDPLLDPCQCVDRCYGKENLDADRYCVRAVSEMTNRAPAPSGQAEPAATIIGGNDAGDAKA